MSKWLRIATILVDGAFIGVLVADIVLTMRPVEDADVADTAERIANGVPSKS